MAIQTIEQRKSSPVLGTIRLGIRQEAKSGSKYPKTVPHFVLTDAPEVARVYGDDPKEIDIIFIAEDIEMNIPTWLMWFGAGIKDKDGNMKGGKLFCKGNGPDVEGRPGVAQFYSKRDPKTGVVPDRPCLGEQCPDWIDKNGARQCKPAMKVLCVLPLVSPYGVYEINTNSWNSIKSFHEQLSWIKTLKGNISLLPFKIVREEENIKYLDKAEGKEKQSLQYVMKLRPNQHFLELHGEKAKAIMATLQNAPSNLLPSGERMEALLAAPREDGYEMIDVAVAQVQEQAAVKVSAAEALAQDPEIQDAFDIMEQELGRKLSSKDRLLLIRKKEKEPDMKAAVLEAVRTAIKSAAKKKAPEATQNTVMDVPAEPSSPVVDSEGIL